MITPVNLSHAGAAVFFSFTGSGTFADPFVITGGTGSNFTLAMTTINSSLVSL